MKIYPFKEYPATMKDSWKLYKTDGSVEEDLGIESYTKDYKSYIDEQKIVRKSGAFVIPPSPELIAVEYTEDEKKIKPQIVLDNETFDMTGIGRYKRKCWEFQSEWRYIIVFAPFDAKEIKKGNAIEKACKSRRIPYKEYYLELSDDAFEGMEVILGPKTTEAEEIVVRAVVEKYQGNYAIEVKRSRLYVK